MLSSLAIRDFVIVERLELEFERGFTVLTGETGAGKSILIDALALVLGERGDATVVRQGAERAEISAEFDLCDAPGLPEWLAEHGFSGDDGACLLRRVVEASGRSRAFVNGSAATLAQLRDAGEFLVDIHGQHQHQSLLRAAAQRELLDAYGGLREHAGRTRQLFREGERLREQCAAFEANSTAIAVEREQLDWQAKELAALDIQGDSWQALQTDHARLAHAASLIEAAEFALDALSEGDAAALPQVNGVVARLKALTEYDPTLSEITNVLEPARIQIQEAVYGLRHYQQKLDLDPERLRAAEVRLDAVHAACRKYRITPEEIPATLERCRARLRELHATGDPEALRHLEREAKAAFLKHAEVLSAGRRKAARKLGSQVTDAMQTLAMAGGTFEVALEPLHEPAGYGAEQVEFRVAAHKSMAPQPLARVASGGELSRLSLAIQTVASRVARVPTLVFDEVDAGIGGRVAEIVGRMLRELGREHQVMCITHLPQVAASADQQWQVAKTATREAVSSRVLVLDAAQRIDEIARMLGGVKITETTRKHAAEMLGAKAALK
ncbi:MAG: DNA repair protein RecN [Burkholderiales bacterium]